MAAMTMDTIMIKIESNANNATGNIDKLASSLSNLRSAVKGGFNNLKKLSESLNELSKASNKIPKLRENLDGISEIAKSLNQLSNIENPKGLQKAVENLEKLPGVMNKITPKHLENVARVSNQLATALTPLSDKLGQIGQGMSALSQLADKYGVSVTKVHNYTKQTHNRFKALGSVLNVVKKAFRGVGDSSKNFSKAAVKQLGSVHSKIKQVGLSLLGTRTLFTAVRKAVSEYMTMDQELTDSISNAWRALGAQLAPAIEYVIYLFTQLIRVIYSIIKALTGVDLIARANAKAMAAWGKSSKDTLGQLQKFDDLNVAEFDDGSGDDKLIDLEEIDLSPIQWIIDATLKIKEALKEAFDTGEWYGVGDALADGINIAMEKLNFDWIEEKLSKVFSEAGSFLNGIFENLDWSSLGTLISDIYKLPYDMGTQLFTSINWTALGAGISSAIASTDFAGMAGSIVDLVSSIGLGLQEAFLQIDFNMVANKFSEALKQTLSKTTDLINAIKWEKLGAKIRETIVNIDWAGIISELMSTIQGVISGAGGFLDGLFGTTIFTDIANTINDIINGILLMGSTITETLGEESSSGKILNTIGNIFSTIVELVSGVASILTEWVISDEFQSLLGTVLEYVDMIFGWVDEIATSITEWYNGEGGQILKDILISLTGIIDDCLKIIKPILEELWREVKFAWDAVIKPVATVILKHIDLLLTALKGILNFIVKVFQGDVEGAFESIKGTIKSVTEKGQDLWKSMINGILGFVEKFVNKVIGSINKIIRAYNGSLGDFFEWLGFEATIKEIAEISIPKLATGTNEIPQEGIYHLHPGEAVVPKKYNPALGNGGSEETNQKLDTLIYLMENMNFTNIVNVGNETLYKKQQAYNKMQNDKYGTTVNL